MITITSLSISLCKRLAEIMSTDERLNNELTPSKPLHPVSANEFYNTCKQWESRTNSICYCILHDNMPIGSISISHCDFENKIAKCGYWIESNCWGRGYATKAFELAINEARAMGFHILTCSILKYNIASILMWKRQGAVLVEEGNRIIPTLSLSKEN